MSSDPSPAPVTPRTEVGQALDRLMEVIEQRTTIEPRHRAAIRSSLRAYRRAIEREAAAPAAAEALDVERLIEAERNTPGPAFPMAEFLPRLAAEYARLSEPTS